MTSCFFSTFASIGGCKLAISSARRPSVLIAIASSLLGSASGWILFLIAWDGAKVLTPDYWLGDAKPGGLEIVLPLVFISIIVSLVPTSIVVAIYQSKWKAFSK